MKFEKCNVLVDYINQSRKPTKAKVANIWLQRDEFANIILVIGEQKSQRQTFKLEDVSRIYPPTDAGKDKVGLEMSGGTVVNVLLSGLTPPEAVKAFVDVCQRVAEDPNSSYNIEIEPHD